MLAGGRHGVGGWLLTRGGAHAHGPPPAPRPTARTSATSSGSPVHSRHARAPLPSPSPALAQMVEMASDKFVCIVDDSKLVSGLGGSKLAMPVEIVQFCHLYTLQRLQVR